MCQNTYAEETDACYQKIKEANAEWSEKILKNYDNAQTSMFEYIEDELCTFKTVFNIKFCLSLHKNVSLIQDIDGKHSDITLNNLSPHEKLYLMHIGENTLMSISEDGNQVIIHNIENEKYHATALMKGTAVKWILNSKFWDLC